MMIRREVSVRLLREGGESLPGARHGVIVRASHIHLNGGRFGTSAGTAACRGKIKTLDFV